MSKPAEKPDAETQAMIDLWDKEHPCYCPLCGSTKIEIRYVEYGRVDWEGYWHAGDMFRCDECGAEGEYE